MLRDLCDEFSPIAFMNIGMDFKGDACYRNTASVFSAGGTALVSMYVSIGMVLSCCAHNNKKYRMFYDED